MLSSKEAGHILDTAEQIYSAAVVSETVKRMAADITVTLSEKYPLVLSVLWRNAAPYRACQEGSDNPPNPLP